MATKFISGFRDCLQRLRKNNAQISDDTDTLRALLLVAIQDNDFEIVRDSIVHKPDMGEDTILTELRECETSLIMKDQVSNNGGDSGTSSSRYSRRVQQTQSPGTPGRAWEANVSSSQKWSIPKYPDSWRLGLGASSFKLRLARHNDTHKGHSQLHLSNEYATFVESFKQNSGKSEGANKSRLPLTVHLPQVLQMATTQF